MPTEAVDVGVSDQDLFDEANADEAPAEEAVVEAATAEPEPEPEQPRDEQGRFAAQAAEQPENPVAANPLPASQEEQPRSERIPLAEYLSEREKRQTFENELRTEREQRLNLERRLAQQSQPEVKAEKPDPLLDPEGYEKYLENKVEERILNSHRENSLAQAHKTYKQDFEEAYAAAQRQIDPALRARMQQSRDPGETLMQWHRERKTMAEVGSDPNAYFDKRLEAYLSDPANQAKALERIRGGAQQQLQPGATKPAPAVSLPPSLTRATNASADTSADDDDMSNDGLWRHANA